MHLQTYELEDFERKSDKSDIFELNEKKPRETNCEYREFDLENNEPAQSIGPSHSGVKSELLFDRKTSEEIKEPVQPSPASPQKKKKKPTSRTQQKRNHKQNWSTQFVRKLIKQSGITLEKHSILKNDLSEELMFQILTKENFYKFVKTRNSMEKMLLVWEVDGDPDTSQSKNS